MPEHRRNPRSLGRGGCQLNVEGRIDAASDAVKKQGQKVLKPKESIGPYVFRSIIEDSEGNVIALYSKTA